MISNFINRVKNGKNINGFLSTKFNKDFVDYHYILFGLHHFHLYPKDNSGHKYHGDILLFAMILDKVYLIDILTHSYFDDYDLASPPLIKTVYDNWPYLLENRKAIPIPMEMVEKEDYPSLNCYKNLVRNGINPLMCIYGIPFAIYPFLGRTTSQRNNYNAVSINICFGDDLSTYNVNKK